MKKLIILALILAGFTTAGLAQSTPAIKKADNTKTMVSKSHKKMHAHTAKLHTENKKAVNSDAVKPSPMLTHPSMATTKSNSMMKKTKTTKMHSNETMMHSGHAYKRHQKMYE